MRLTRIFHRTPETVADVDASTGLRGHQLPDPTLGETLERDALPVYLRHYG